MKVPEQGPPMVEKTFPLPLETLTKPADNRKQCAGAQEPLGVNLTHSPCHAPGQAATGDHRGREGEHPNSRELS